MEAALRRVAERPPALFAWAALVVIALASAVALAWPALPWNAAPEPGQRTGVILRQLGPSTAVVGQPAPDFEWAMPDGSLQRLSGLRDRPVIVNFWATWCKPCLAEMPLLARAARNESVHVIAVDLDESPETIDAYFRSLALDPLVPVLDAGRTTATRWGLVGVPTSFFIDRDGIIRHVEMRELDEARLRDALAKVR